MKNKYNMLKNRFREFYPVVIDIETTGCDYKTHALIEIAVITLTMDTYGWLKKETTIHFHIKPFIGSIIEEKSLLCNKIDLFNPLRQAVHESVALRSIFDIVYHRMKFNQCKKSIIVAHNAYFDYQFLMEAIKRCKIKNNLFHPFSIFDTATLSGLSTGQTVLSKACRKLGSYFDNKKAHSALYDTLQTANLFCKIINKWKKMGGWPIK